MFDGSDARAASAGRAAVRVVSEAPAGARFDVAHFDKALPSCALTGNATATVCAGVAPNPELDKTPCVTTGDNWQQPHWASSLLAQSAPTTAVTKLTWSGKGAVLRVNLPVGHRDVRKYSTLTFRAAPDAGTSQTDISLRVVVGHGKSVTVPVSQYGDALVWLPRADEFAFPKTLLRTIRVPLTALTGLANTRDGNDLKISLVLALPQQAILGNALGHAIVLDGDPEPVLTVTGRGLGREGSPTIGFPVKLSAPSDKFVAITGIVHDGTARVGSDYTAFSQPGVPGLRISGFVAPGQLVGSVQTGLVNDKVREPDEPFGVTIHDVSGAVWPAPRMVKGTIVDDD